MSVLVKHLLLREQKIFSWILPDMKSVTLLRMKVNGKFIVYTV